MKTRIRTMIKRKLRLILFFFTIGILMISCEKELDIQTDFPFQLEVMPVPSEIDGEQTVEILCHIKREGQYNGVKYSIRYFQYEGHGALMFPSSKPFKPNYSYLIPEDDFVLHYKTKSKGSHEFQIWVYDSFGNEKTMEFSFNY